MPCVRCSFSLEHWWMSARDRSSYNWPTRGLVWGYYELLFTPPIEFHRCHYSWQHEINAGSSPSDWVRLGTEIRKYDKRSMRISSASPKIEANTTRTCVCFRCALSETDGTGLASQHVAIVTKIYGHINRLAIRVSIWFFSEITYCITIIASEYYNTKPRLSGKLSAQYFLPWYAYGKFKLFNHWTNCYSQ